MFSDFLFCIFSYNRGDFLENLLSSICKFYPEASLAIFDDGSDDPKVRTILKDISEQTYVHVTDKTNPDCKHGGLYNMMNVAIEYAKNSPFKYAYFVQDDMQFLWRDELLPQRLSEAFRRQDCIMCNCNFLLKIFKHDTIDELHRIENTGMYTFAKHGVGDTGIIELAQARTYNLNFPHQAERKNGEYWQSKGFRLYWLAQPNLAWMPWPKVYRYKKAERDKVHTLYLKNGAVERLEINKDYAFMEDYAKTDAFLLRPYWHGASHGKLNMLKIYTKYLLGLQLLKH